MQVFCGIMWLLYNSLEMCFSRVSVFLIWCVCACVWLVCSQPSSRCATPGLSAATLASLGGTSSRRGSADTGSIYDPDTSLSELRVRCKQSRHSINMADSSVWGGESARIWPKCQTITEAETLTRVVCLSSVCLHLVPCPTWICHSVSSAVSSSCSQCLD